MIGWGSPNKAGTKSTHGEALGVDEVAAARVKLGWTSPPFEIPAPIRAAWDQRERGTAAQRQWAQRFSAYETGVSGAGAANSRGACAANCPLTGVPSRTARWRPRWP